MSEHIDNSKFRKSELKRLILKLHDGESEDEVKEQLKESLRSIPYGEVVEVEQELIEEGLPEDEILRLCDMHSSVLEGSIDQSSSKDIPTGHPVDVLKQENKALSALCSETNMLLAVLNMAEEKGIPEFVLDLISKF